MTGSASLVQYTSPVLVSSTGAKKGKAAKEAIKQTATQAEDILNSILPPREWTEDQQLWVQYVSSTPATRVDVINLQEDLDKRLQQRQARETGICPIREELYAQCFDEIIRQVTIICAERGLLLLRVRDEIRMTVCSYQSLYESSIAFGMRKALQAEQHNNQQSKELKKLSLDNQQLHSDVEDLKKKIADAKINEEAERKQEQEEHQANIGGLTKQNEELKEHLETILSAPKK